MTLLGQRSLGNDSSVPYYSHMRHSMCRIPKSATQTTQRITENDGEIRLSLSALYPSSTLWGPPCTLWLFSVFSVLISGKRRKMCQESIRVCIFGGVSSRCKN